MWLDGAKASGKEMFADVVFNTPTNLYTAPTATANTTDGSSTAMVTNITISGRNIANATVSIFIVDAADTPVADDKALLLNIPVPTNDARIITFERGGELQLAPGRTIKAVASVANAVNIFMSGVEVQ